MTEKLLTFKVRPGLTIGVESFSPRGEKTITGYGAPFGTSEVALTLAQVALHAHAIEPVCAEGASLLEKFRHRSEIIGQRGPDLERLRIERENAQADAIAARIVARLTDGGSAQKARRA